MRHLPSGVIDTHVHAGPDIVPRLMDDRALVAAARDAGYRGIVIKSHVEGTASRAAVARAVEWPNGDVLGGIALNRHSIGGLNPTGVATALALGARIVWLPTLSSVVQCRHSTGPARDALPKSGGVTGAVIEIGHELLRKDSELDEIFRLIAASNATLATGHLDPAMLLPVVEFAVQCGVPRVLITHPEAPFLRVTVADQAVLAAIPNVWFERCYLSVLTGVPVAQVADEIRTVGVHSTVLATDLGQPGNPSPIEGLADFARQLALQGISESDLELMLVQNPSAALGLQTW